MSISKYGRLLLISFTILLLSCAGGRMYVNDEADFGFYSSVGVVPLANLTTNKNASEKVTSSFVTELLRLNTISLANQGDLEKVLKEVGWLGTANTSA